MEAKYTKIAWAGREICQHTNNSLVKSVTGRIICEMHHPIDRGHSDLMYIKEVEEQRANELLIRHCVAVLERLNDLQEKLKMLKEGKLSIFDFDINTEVEKNHNVIVRATKLD